MRQILLSVMLCFLALQYTYAQGPKWVTKSKRAVFSVMTFDKDDHLLKTGNGFFISDKGIGVSDYNLFKGAYRAIVINSEGKELPVYSILGADDTYDVVKFRVDITDFKKMVALEPFTDSVKVGSEVVVLPYSVQKDRLCKPGKIKRIDRIRDNYAYYTLDLRVGETLISCPVLNSDGKVVALLQRNFADEDSMTSHAVDINFIRSLQVQALSYGDITLKDIHIKKGLPEEESDALIYLYMVSANSSQQEIGDLLNDFIYQFPNSNEGYLKRAQHILNNATDMKDVARADEDMKKAYTVSTNKDEVLFSLSKIILANQNVELLNNQSDWSLDEALKKINEAISIKKEPIYIQIKGEILVALERYDEALTCYDEVNKSDIASAASFYNTALVNKVKGVEDTVVLALMDSCINRLEKPYTMNAAPYLFERAQLLEEAGKNREALLDLKEYYYAVDGQVNANFFYYREQVAVKARLYQQAFDDLDLALQLEPNETLYIAEKASLNLRVGRYKEALEDIEKILNIDSKNGEAYRLQGVAYIQLKDNRACESLQKAKELGDPLVDQIIEKHCK